MSKPFYTEYVRHALRFYARYLGQIDFKSNADKQNWLSANSIIKSYTEPQATILLEVYGGFDTIPDEVYNASKKHNIDQSQIWDMLKEVERRTAKRRGLI